MTCNTVNTSSTVPKLDMSVKHLLQVAFTLTRRSRTAASPGDPGTKPKSSTALPFAGATPTSKFEARGGDKRVDPIVVSLSYSRSLEPGRRTSPAAPTQSSQIPAFEGDEKSSKDTNTPALEPNQRHDATERAQQG